MSLVGEAIALAANGLQQDSFTEAATYFLEHLKSDKDASSEYAFPHARITEAAFPDETESALSKAREFLQPSRRFSNSYDAEPRMYERPRICEFHPARMDNISDGTLDLGSKSRHDYRKDLSCGSQMPSATALLRWSKISNHLRNVTGAVSLISSLVQAWTALRQLPTGSFDMGDYLPAIRKQVRLYKNVRARTCVAWVRRRRDQSTPPEHVIRYSRKQI